MRMRLANTIRRCNWSLADKITIARMLLFPFMWAFAILNYANALIILLITDRIGDIADGYIARRLKQESKFGGKLDALSDMAVYMSIVLWSFLIFPDIYLKNLDAAALLLFFIILPAIISLIRFNEVILFHLISSKILGGLIAASFLALIWQQHGILPPFLLLLSAIIIFNSIERIIILLSKRKVIYEDIKSVFGLYEHD